MRIGVSRGIAREIGFVRESFKGKSESEAAREKEREILQERREVFQERGMELRERERERNQLSNPLQRDTKFY